DPTKRERAGGWIMSGAAQVCWKLGGTTACGVIVLAGLLEGYHWHRSPTAATSPLEATSLSNAGAERDSLTVAPEPRTISNPAKQPAAPDSAALLFRPAAVSSSATSLSSRAQAMKTYAALPMMFEANNGQADPRVKFIAHA